MAAPLKDQFDREVVDLLAERFSVRCADFDAERFRETLLDAFPALELKERINLVADCLADLLPREYETALAHVVGVAESEVGGSPPGPCVHSSNATAWTTPRRHSPPWSG